MGRELRSFEMNQENGLKKMDKESNPRFGTVNFERRKHRSSAGFQRLGLS
jgi:hypothetical protein